MSKYDEIKVGDFVEIIQSEPIKHTGQSICKVIQKNDTAFPEPNIVVEGKEGKTAVFHSTCGEAYFKKANSYLG